MSAAASREGQVGDCVRRTTPAVSATLLGRLLSAAASRVRPLLVPLPAAARPSGGAAAAVPPPPARRGRRDRAAGGCARPRCAEMRRDEPRSCCRRLRSRCSRASLSLRPSFTRSRRSRTSASRSREGRGSAEAPLTHTRTRAHAHTHSHTHTHTHTLTLTLTLTRITRTHTHTHHTHTRTHTRSQTHRSPTHTGLALVNAVGSKSSGDVDLTSPHRRRLSPQGQALR